MTMGLLAAALGGLPASAGAAGAPTAAASAVADDERDVGLLRPLGRGTYSSDPEPVATLPNGVALLVADDGVHGPELWRSDGTAGGTAMLGDLVSGPEGADPWAFVVDGPRAAFVAATGGLGAPELWRSDGTPAGTARVESLSSLGAADVESLVPWRGGYAFSYTTADGLAHIGFAEGGSVRELHLGALGGGRPGFPVRMEASIGDRLYYTDFGDLHATDGTLAGTVVIPTDDGGAGAVVATTLAGDRLAVLATTDIHGTAQAGVVEGTTFTRLGTATTSFLQALGDRVLFSAPEGTRTWAPGEPVRTLESGAPGSAWTAIGFGDSMIGDLGNGVAVYPVTEADGVWRLHRTDGTVQGTSAIPVHATYPRGFAAIGGGRAVFVALDDRAGSRGSSIWVTDGTTQGTRKIGLDEPIDPTRLLAPTAHGAVYAGFDDHLGIELFGTDGTAAGTGLVADLDTIGRGSDPLDATVVGNRVVFSTQLEDGAVWSTDGTAAGTVPLLEHGIGGTIPNASEITATDDGRTAYFGAADDLLYRTDGTRVGTAPVAHVDNARYLVGLGTLGPSFLFARPVENTHYNLMGTDGTLAGTRSLGGDDGNGVPYVVAKGPRTMLIQYPHMLLRTDGTSAGTDYVPSYAGGNYDTFGVAVADGFLAKIDPDGQYGFELQHLNLDGVADAPVADLEPGVASSNPGSFGTLANGDVLFVAGPINARAWWITDPRGQRPRKFMGLPGEPWSAPRTVAGVTYVSTYDRSARVISLYRTDGTAEGTALLHRFEPDVTAVPWQFTAFAGRVYFAAADQAHGDELWETDGTAAGTRLARDIAPGPADSSPSDLVATGDFLFFSADDGAVGPEPWRVRRATPTGDGGDAPAVTVDPLPSPIAAGGDAWAGGGSLAGLAGALDGKASSRGSAVRVGLTVKRLRAAKRGATTTRWRVSGAVTGTPSTGTACSGRVRIVLGRGTRALKTTTVTLKRCRFATTLATTSRASGRWIEVRTVPKRGGLPAATSRRAAA